MYVAIINQPGYLPETEPVEFEFLWEAWHYLADEIEIDWDSVEAPDIMTFHKANKAWAACHEAAMQATKIGAIEAPNGLLFSVEIAE